MKEVPLSNGMIALVDEDDYELVSRRRWSFHRGSPTKPGYATGTGGERMHRLIMGVPKNDPRIVDHIDGNTLNNCKANLRITDAFGNNKNKSNTNNRHGLKGVAKYKKGVRWFAYIQANKKRVYLGTFATAEEAHAAYCRAADELHGEFANYGHQR